MQNISNGNLVRPVSTGLFKSQWKVFGSGRLKFIDERLVQSDLSTEKSLQCCCHCCDCCYSMKVQSGFHKAVATTASVLISLATAKTVYASQWLLLRRLPSHLQVSLLQQSLLILITTSSHLVSYLQPFYS